MFIRPIFTAATALVAAMFAPVAAVEAATGNVLLVIADDYGWDAAFASPARAPTIDPPAPQPNLQALAAKGITFGNFDAHQECSPTRAALRTGQHLFRPENGVGQWISPTRVDLPAQAFTIDDAFTSSAAGQRYLVDYVGKLHLYHATDGVNAPLLQGGIRDFNGPLPGGAINDYYRWTNFANGVQSGVTTYATTFQSDMAIREIAEARFADRPFFLTLSYNAPHQTNLGYQQPPLSLLSATTRASAAEVISPRAHYDQMIEALDHELGRVLATVDLATTTVIFMGDNGTPGAVGRAPYTGFKSSPYQGGINVPLVIAGEAVAGPVPRVEKRMAQDVDLFATILDLAGIDLAATVPPGRVIDGKSLRPYLADPLGPSVHPYNYNEEFTDGVWTAHAIRSIRGTVYKLITRGSKHELYRIFSDPHETDNLLRRRLTPAGAEAYPRLLAAMNALLATR